MACYADINVSQGSVAIYARRGGIFNIHLTANLSGNLPLIFFNRLRFDRIMAMSLWPRCFDPPCSRSQGQPGRKVSRKHSPGGASTWSGLSLSMVMIQRRVSHLSQTDPRDVRRVVHTGGRSVCSTDQGRTELTTLATVGVYFSDT